MKSLSSPDVERKQNKRKEKAQTAQAFIRSPMHHTTDT